ncbi:MAG TPA: ACT domain-containing protein [Kiritimatiellia bacterium]|nr:ACT domain-containing protein [Kiritimatiellia bacterium]
MGDDLLIRATVGHQISVYLDNRPGSLAETIDLLGAHNINLLALSLSEGLEIGYLRITVDNLEGARTCLEAAGHLVHDREVILLEVANRPGGLAAAIDKLAARGVNIEYAYSADSPRPDHSLIVVRVEDVARGLAALEA